MTVTTAYHLVLLLAAAALGGACAAPGPGFRSPSVPYVATPDDVGVEMLRLAGVSSRDTVYDLGSGDGRVVLAAALSFGARGVGVEIDPRLVQESRERAVTSGVTDRVSFRWQDLFQADIDDATAVMIYLLPEINLQLRPKLLAELRPGTRIVSHRFDMGDWRPDRTVEVRTADSVHGLHLWIVPARVDGAWLLDVVTPAGAQRSTVTFEQRFQQLAGTIGRERGEAASLRGSLRGEEITFSAVTERAPRFRGRVDGDRAAGVVEIPGEPSGHEHPWTARRASR